MQFQLPVLGAQKISYSVQDIRILQRNLRQIEPELRRQFVREIKEIGKQAQTPIKRGLQSVTPLSGMRHTGKTGWGIGKRIDSTTVRFRTAAGGKSLTTSLVSVRINSPIMNIFDMAGRSGRSIGQGYRGSGMTREFVKRRRDGSTYLTRRATTTEAGRKFIDNLNRASGVIKRSASRIAWPAVEKDLPDFERKIDKVVINYYRIANRKFS